MEALSNPNPDVGGDPDNPGNNGGDPVDPTIQGTVNSIISGMSYSNKSGQYPGSNFSSAADKVTSNEGGLNAIAETALKIASASAISRYDCSSISRKPNSAEHEVCDYSTGVSQSDWHSCMCAGQYNGGCSAKACIYCNTTRAIHYSWWEHYYSDSYSNDSSDPNDIGKLYYSLSGTLNNIANGKQIYTDCFGFVRLVLGACGYSSYATGMKYSTINQSISTTSSANDIKSGAILKALNNDGSNKHVAIFLYNEGSTCYYVDQFLRIYSATYNGSTLVSEDGNVFSYYLNID